MYKCLLSLRSSRNNGHSEVSKRCLAPEPDFGTAGRGPSPRVSRLGPITLSLGLKMASEGIHQNPFFRMAPLTRFKAAPGRTWTARKHTSSERKQGKAGRQAKHESVGGIIPGTIHRGRAATGIKKRRAQGQRIDVAEFRDAKFPRHGCSRSLADPQCPKETAPPREHGIYRCREWLWRIEAGKAKGLECSQGRGWLRRWRHGKLSGHRNRTHEIAMQCCWGDYTAKP